jgi:hypothetical protein
MYGKIPSVREFLREFLKKLLPLHSCHAARMRSIQTKPGTPQTRMTEFFSQPRSRRFRLDAAHTRSMTVLVIDAAGTVFPRLQ